MYKLRYPITDSFVKSSAIFKSWLFVLLWKNDDIVFSSRVMSLARNILQVVLLPSLLLNNSQLTVSPPHQATSCGAMTGWRHHSILLLASVVKGVSRRSETLWFS